MSTSCSNEDDQAPPKKAPPAGARLRIRHARLRCAPPPAPSHRPLGLGCARLKVAVGGTIAKAARGAVRIKVSARPHGRRVSAARRAPIRAGRWHARLALPWARRHRKAIQISAGFKGSAGVGVGHARRRVGLR